MARTLTHCKTCGSVRKTRTRHHKGLNPYLESWCAPCNSKKAKAYYKANPHKRTEARANESKIQQKKHRLRKNYNLSLAEYDEMLQKQDGKCATCQLHFSVFKRALAVDHDHSSGKIRGLLCGSCNSSLGLLKENFDTVLRLAKYIQTHKDII